MKRIWGPVVLAVLGWWLVSCTPAESSGVDARDLDPFSPDAVCAYQLGNPQKGEALFNQPVLAGSSGCANCHSLEPDHVLKGPSLYNLAETADKRIPGVIAANYIFFSITRPNYYLVEGFAEDVMPANYGTDLTNEEITDLVSYLMTLTETN